MRCIGDSPPTVSGVRCDGTRWEESFTDADFWSRLKKSSDGASSGELIAGNLFLFISFQDVINRLPHVTLQR